MMNVRMKKGLFVICAIAFVLAAGTRLSAFIPGQYNDDASTLALYHLNQSSGTTVIDDASTGRTVRNGALYGSPLPAWTAGDFGNGLHTNFGGGGGVNVGPLTGLTANYTIEFYFKWDYAYVSELGNLFYAQEAAFARSFLVEHGESPATYRINYGVRRGDGAWMEIITPEDSILDTNWHHLAFTRSWDGVNVGFAIYVDGVQKAGSSFAGGFWEPGLDVLMPFSSSMGGTFDEIRFSKVVRTEFGLRPCGEGGYNTSDINKDCYVDFKDFAALAEGWMTCTDPNNMDCVNCNELVFAPGTVDANTVALWHLNEGVGSTAYDETSYRPLAINAGGSDYTWATASAYGLDKCLHAPPGNTSYCRSAVLPIANPSNITNRMTISAWIRPEGISPSGSYIASTDTSAILRLGGDSFGVIAEALFYDWRSGWSGPWPPAASKNVGMIDYNWHHIAGVYDGIPDSNGNANYYLYWDGVQVDKKSIPAVDPDPAHAGRVGLTLVDTGTGELYIGGKGDPNQAFQGFIDDVKVDNTARTKFFNTACE